MVSFWRSRFDAIKSLLHRLPGFSRHGPHSLAFLNAAQFFGVLNDNIFKLAIVFLLIDAEGPQNASNILSAAGAIFVVPFLLFSSSAGILADRISKQKLLMLMKVAEMIIMTIALFAFAYKSEWACYTLLFLLSTHSAAFGPSKYGIIPELVTSESLSKANGLITSFTYLAVIIGTFLASFLTEITHRNFILVASFCLLVAILGFLSTLGIKRTPAQRSIKQINFLFIREIYQTLVFSKTIKHLLTAIFGSAFFLFIGAFAQLNIIPFTLQSLHLDEVSGGYLFLATALGIALGAIVAGRASKKRVELGMSCLAGFLIAVFLMLLFLFSHHLIAVIILLVLLGICGGAFIVPFDSFAQLFSPDGKRGQVIAAANFLSFCGVLVASFALYLFSEIFGISSASGFAVMGVITLIVSCIFTMRLSDLALPYFSKKLMRPFFPIELIEFSLLEKSQQPLLIIPKATWFHACLLLSVQPNLFFIIPSAKSSFLWLKNLFYSFYYIPYKGNPSALLHPIKEIEKQGGIPCLFLREKMQKENAEIVNVIKDNPEAFFVHIERSGAKRLSMQIIFSKTETPASTQGPS
jgi:acyl-[acyl-carrier-protein]-phospholipid O-acyltransferase / long-chain-fatty-acid--[acyl-carrier-protein] ligase